MRSAGNPLAEQESLQGAASPAGPPGWKVPFFAIWTGQAFSLFGSGLVQFALVWWITQLTGSATALAMATLISMLPSVLLGPFAGALVDRFSRRWTMVVADGVIALASAWLAYLSWSGKLRVGHVYAIMLVRSLGGTFHWPAMVASTSLMVPKKQLGRVGGMNQTLEGVLGIVSPPLGASLLSLLPLHGIMGIDVVTALLGIIPLLAVSVPQPARTYRVEMSGLVRTLFQDMGEGLQYIFGWPGLKALILGAVTINFLFVPASSLLPILVAKHFGGGAIELGWMNSALGIGILLGGLGLSLWGGFRRRIVTSLVALIGLGVGGVLIGLTPATAFPMALVALVFVGAMLSLTNGPLHATMQATIRQDMQARVFTVLTSIAGAMAPVGLAIAGPVADVLGVRIWYIVGGIGCAALGGSAFLLPAVIHIEDQFNEGSPRPEELTAERKLDDTSRLDE